MKPLHRPLLALAATASALSAEAAQDGALPAPPPLPETSCLDPRAGAARPVSGEAPVLVEGLGWAGLEADSDDPQARAWFAQGVRLVWAFDEAEAVRAFRQAQSLDPRCALCHFGEAWARSPTLNLQPRNEELEPARAAARRAVALAGRLASRDRLLVRAMEIRTAKGESFQQAPYAAFLESAALRNPADPTLAILAADARMQVSEKIEPGSLSQRLLERVLAREPDHAGAIHFYIHLTDWIDRQHLALPYAERLGRLAPAASHLVHMPSHSFFGVGRYADAAAVNVAAIAADRLYADRVRPPESGYRKGLLAHNMHFAIISALARGDGSTALEVSRQFETQYLTGAIAPYARLLGSAVHYSRGRHGDPAALLARPLPEAPLDRVFHHYARGEMLARRGEPSAVAAEARAIHALLEGKEAPALGRAGTALARTVRHVLVGRSKLLAGDAGAAVEAYRAAMEAQLTGDLGSDPPLFWYSVRRSLAAALLAAGDAEGARRQIHASLRRWPNDALALRLLAAADAKLGDLASAGRNLERARRLWKGDVEAIPVALI